MKKKVGAWAGCWSLGFLALFAVSGFQHLTGWNETSGTLDGLGWIAMTAIAAMLGVFFLVLIQYALGSLIERQRQVWAERMAEDLKNPQHVPLQPG